MPRKSSRPAPPPPDAPPKPGRAWFPPRRERSALTQLAFAAVEQRGAATYAALKDTPLVAPACPSCREPMAWFDMIGGEDRATFERASRERNGTDFFFSLYPYYCERCRQGYGVGFSADGRAVLYSAYPFRGR